MSRYQAEPSNAASALYGHSKKKQENIVNISPSSLAGRGDFGVSQSRGGVLRRISPSTLLIYGYYDRLIYGVGILPALLSDTPQKNRNFLRVCE